MRVPKIEGRRSGRLRPQQLSLPLRGSWGGRRAGAGRKPGPGLPRVQHRARPEHNRRHPVHVTLRARLSSLRSQFVFPTVRLAIASLRGAEGFRIAHFSVQSNHLHLLVEADNKARLSSGLRSLVIRIAVQVNRLLMRRGPVWADRFHIRRSRLHARYATSWFTCLPTLRSINAVRQRRSTPAPQPPTSTAFATPHAPRPHRAQRRLPSSRREPGFCRPAGSATAC
jgi:REP element-mobilizing transposase RayT